MTELARAQSVAQVVHRSARATGRACHVYVDRSITQAGDYVRVELAVNELEPMLDRGDAMPAIERAIGALVVDLRGRYNVVIDGHPFYREGSPTWLAVTLTVEAEPR